MQTLNYKKIQKIEISATEKLLNYISTISDFDDLLEEIEFFYPAFDDAKNRLAFSIWLSMDFITESGETFIAQFLDEKSSELTSEEKEVLIERDKSNISLFEIIDIDIKYIYVLDLLQNKKYVLEDLELTSIITTGDIIFSRMGNLLGHLTFIGDLNFLPTEMKDLFKKQVFLDFNLLRSDKPMLTIKEYLKNHSLNLYSIYTNCMLEAMELEDTTSNLYNELDEFEGYLGMNTSNEIIRQSITILMEFFEYYLADKDFTLYDLNKLDLDLFFREAIKDNFISSKENLHSYISTFKKYIKFLNINNSEYKKTYEEILKISQNRFSYMDLFKSVKPIFKIDQDFANLVSNILNEEALSILMDLDRFILFLIDEPLELTKINKHIKRNDLYEIQNRLTTGDFPNQKAPNQKDFQIIHLFFNLTTSLGILSIEEDFLCDTNKSSNYLRLKDEEKYTLFFQYIWDVKELKEDLVCLLSSFDENIKYSIDEIMPDSSENTDFLSEYYFYLQYLGIIKRELYPSYKIELTHLGKSIIEFLEKENEEPIKCSIISLKDFKKKR